jgi:hypothetical protein
MTARSCVGAALVLVVFTAMSIGAQSIDVVWDLPIALTEADRLAILSLARDAGIRDVARVSEPIRSPCPLVEVRSTPRVEGNRVQQISWASVATPRCGQGAVPEGRVAD